MAFLLNYKLLLIITADMQFFFNFTAIFFIEHTLAYIEHAVIYVVGTLHVNLYAFCLSSGSYI